MATAKTADTPVDTPVDTPADAADPVAPVDAAPTPAPTPEPTPAPAAAEVPVTYTCTRRVNHDGADHEPDSPITLTYRYAEPLLACGAIKAPAADDSAAVPAA